MIEQIRLFFDSVFIPLSWMPDICKDVLSAAFFVLALVVILVIVGKVIQIIGPLIQVIGKAVVSFFG